MASVLNITSSWVPRMDTPEETFVKFMEFANTLQRWQGWEGVYMLNRERALLATAYSDAVLNHVPLGMKVLCPKPNEQEVRFLLAEKILAGRDHWDRSSYQLEEWLQWAEREKERGMGEPK